MKTVFHGGLLILLAGLALHGQTSIEKHEKSLLNVEMNIDSLRLVRENLINENVILAGQIQHEKIGHDRSYREHKKLEKQLQQAQHLNLEILQTEQQISRLNAQVQDSLTILLREISAEIDRRIGQAGYAATENERQNHLLESQKLLAVKTRWSQRLTAPQSVQGPLIPLEITPWDNAASLTLKRDALLDQEESLRGEVTAIDKKIKSFEKEKKMRRKMAEMSGDINLFSEQEETFDRLSLAGQPNTRATDWEMDSGEYETLDSNAKYFHDTAGNQSEIAYYQQDGLISLDERSHPVSLEDRLALLKAYKGKLEIRADSLLERAHWFENRARSAE